jgi:CRP-like cAMP-binding protein
VKHIDAQRDKMFSPNEINTYKVSGSAVPTSKQREGVPHSLNRVRPLAVQLSPTDRARSDMLKDLTEEEMTLLVLLSRVITCKGGEMVARVGEPSGQLFLVLAGALVEISGHMRKQTQPAAIFLRGDTVADASFSTRGLRKTSIAALEECQLLAITAKTLDGLIGTQPRTAAKIFRNLAAIAAARFQVEIGSSVPQAMATLPITATPSFPFPA